MSSILDKYAPLKTVTVKPRARTSNLWFTSYLQSEKGKREARTSNLWFTSYLQSEKGKRQQLERTWRKTHNESDILVYKKLCHFYNSIEKKKSIRLFLVF